MPPHGTCFQGDPLTLFVRPENEKQDFRLEVCVMCVCDMCRVCDVCEHVCTCVCNVHV